MAVVTTRQLLESGVHFGHQTRRWNPKMKKFIFAERNGIYIIDLQQSLTYIDQAYAFVRDTVARGGQILFVGTKKQAQEAIAEQATRVGMPFVNQRWLGGMLTNFATISKRIGKMKELEGINFDDVAASGLTKKELLQQRRKKDKLAKTLSGIRDMGKLPQAVWVVDTKKEHLAIDEARKLRIPIVGILDTNCDPDEVDFAIPGNDDAIRSVALLTRVVADAVAEGLLARSRSNAGTGEEAEPMADWERELLGAADEAAAPAQAAAPSEAEAVEGSDLQADQLADAVEDAVTGAAQVDVEAAQEIEAAEVAADETVEPAVEAAAEPVAEADAAQTK
ncbi:30S ribosomal protein S2 [Micropruina sonneratiae]|uniref:30S ribosomal protein S2 n=1 Tax=Micropruina sonneratiae TaxID=2986940 RepID=UPI00222713F5|nr:30S ribosomal protein S2 [Micropruina sp. KQZ13P-5]MCW3157233.1 30S ribosomal protein S2 [Micropruina sp. KQZ13P-5]